jgi:hypothetical protein
MILGSSVLCRRVDEDMYICTYTYAHTVTNRLIRLELNWVKPVRALHGISEMLGHRMDPSMHDPSHSSMGRQCFAEPSGDSAFRVYVLFTHRRPVAFQRVSIFLPYSVCSSPSEQNSSH